MTDQTSFMNMLTYGVRTIAWRPMHSIIYIAVISVAYIAWYSWGQSEAGLAFYMAYAESSIALETGQMDQLGTFFQTLGLMALGGFLFGAIMYAGGYRVMVRQDANAFMPVGFGADEIRFIGLSLVFGAILIGLLVVVSLVFGILAATILAGTNAQMLGAALGGLFALLMTIPLLYILGRISVSFPLSIRERRFTLGGWSASKGLGWKLFFAHVLLYIVAAGVQFVLAADLMAASLGGQVADPMELARMTANPYGDLMLIAAPIQVLMLFLMLGPTAAVAAHFEDDEMVRVFADDDGNADG